MPVDVWTSVQMRLVEIFEFTMGQGSGRSGEYLQEMLDKDR